MLKQAALGVMLSAHGPNSDSSDSNSNSSGNSGSVAVADFEAWCAAHAGATCNVWLCAELTLPLRAEPGSHFADEDSLAAWARRVHAHYGHEADGAVAGWRSGGVAGACLLQGTPLEGLLSSAARHGVVLAALRPYWAGALALAWALQPALRRGPALLLVAQGRVVTALSLQGGAVVAVAQHWLASADAAALAALAALQPADTPTLAIGHGMAGALPPGVRAIGSLQQDAQAAVDALRHTAAPAPDFIVQPLKPARRLGWALAATGLCVLALAAQDALEAHAGLQALQQPAAISPLQATPATPAPDAAARARLAHPWPVVVAAAEATVPRAGHWLGLEHRAGQRELRLQGVAASLPDALAAAEQVRRTAGVDEAFVARSGTLPERGVEFEILARLAP